MIVAHPVISRRTIPPNVPCRAIFVFIFTLPVVFRTRNSVCDAPAFGCAPLHIRNSSSGRPVHTARLHILGFAADRPIHPCTGIRRHTAPHPCRNRRSNHAPPTTTPSLETLLFGCASTEPPRRLTQSTGRASKK